MSKKTRGMVAFAGLCALSLFLLNCGSSTSRPAGLLYVLSQGASDVSSYAINLNNGNLSLINSNASTCSTAPCGFPEDIFLDPTGKVTFVLNQGVPNPNSPPGVPATIYGYTVNSDGSLSAPAAPVQVNTTADNDLAVAMARDSAGQFLFVITQGSIPAPTTCGATSPPAGCPALWVFAMQSGSTTLTPVAGSPFRLSKRPTALALSPITVTIPDPGNPATNVTGPLLYVTTSEDLVGNNSDMVTEYIVDQSTGNVLPWPNGLGLYASAGTPTAVLSVSTSPIGGTGGLFVYIANTTTNSVGIYQVCTVQNASCSLQDKDDAKMLPVGSPSNAGSDPVAMVVDPKSNFLYVASKNSNQVFGFRINATQGTLSPLSPANMSTGSSPIALAMHSSGKFLFVSNNAGSSISGFNVDTTSGAMSSPITITSAAQPAGLVAK